MSRAMWRRSRSVITSTRIGELATTVAFRWPLSSAAASQEVTLFELGDLLGVTDHLCASVKHDHEFVCEIALLQKRLAFGDIHLVGDRGDLL